MIASTFAAFISKAESVWLQIILQSQKIFLKMRQRTKDLKVIGQYSGSRH
jgi:hypothetical protein